jgi:hypothetical protein
MDVERVEVLKRPQGTLYGRNTTAGAVSFITNKPTQTPSAGVDVTVGDYGRVSTDGFVNGPLTPHLSARLSFSGERQFDGYFVNDLTGKDWGQTRRVAGRAQLLYENDDTSILLNLHGGIDRLDDWYYKYIADASGVPLGQQLQAIARSENPDIFHCVHTIQPQRYSDNQDDGATLTVQHDFAGASLKSITAGEDMPYQRSEDYGSVPAPDRWNRYGGHLGTASKELRLTSTNTGWWKWIVGAYAGFDRLNESDISNEIANPIYQGYIFNERYAQGTCSLAVSTNNVVELLPGLHLTLGGRYTYELRHYVGGTYVLQRDPVLAFDTCPCTVNTRLTYNVPAVKAGLDYKFQNTLVYASVSTGYKAGGVTGFYVTDVGAKKPYMPEFVNAYEIGEKTDLIHNTLRLNASVFYYDYRDLQAFGVIDNEFHIFNVARTRVDGSEIEADWLPVDALQLTSGLGLLQTRVEQLKVFLVPFIQEENTSSFSEEKEQKRILFLLRFGFEHALQLLHENLDGAALFRSNGEGDLERRGIAQNIRQQYAHLLALHPDLPVMDGQIADIDAGENQPRRRLHVVHVGRWPRRLQRPDIPAAPIAARDHRITRDRRLGDVPLRRGKQGVALAAIETVPLLVQRQIGQPEQHFRKTADRDVEPSLDQLAQQIVGRAAVQGEHDILVGAREGANGAMQRRCIVQYSIVHNSDGDAALETVTQRADLVVVLLQRRRRVSGFRVRPPRLPGSGGSRPCRAGRVSPRAASPAPKYDC